MNTNIMRNKNGKATKIKTIDILYCEALKELENYVKYALRCLHRANIYPQPKDFIWLLVPRNNGTIGEAVLYPETSFKNGELTEPMFFMGYKMDYDFKDLTKPIVVKYCDNIEDLRK